MNKNNQKRATMNNSSSGSSPKLLQALHKLLVKGGGSVSYVFVTERLRRKPFINKEGRKDFTLEPYKVKSMLHCQVGPEALISNNPKVAPNTVKTTKEMLEMFHGTKHDLGADFFIID